MSGMRWEVSNEILDYIERSVVLLGSLTNPVSDEEVLYLGAGVLTTVPLGNLREEKAVQGTVELVTARHCVDELRAPDACVRFRRIDGTYKLLGIHDELTWYRAESSLDPNAEIVAVPLNAERYRKEGYDWKAIPDFGLLCECFIREGERLVFAGRDPHNVTNREARIDIRKGEVLRGVDKVQVEYESGDKEIDAFISSIEGDLGDSGSPVFLIFQDENGEDKVGLAGIVIAAQNDKRLVVAPAERVYEAIHNERLDARRRALLQPT